MTPSIYCRECGGILTDEGGKLCWRCRADLNRARYEEEAARYDEDDDRQEDDYR